MDLAKTEKGIISQLPNGFVKPEISNSKKVYLTNLVKNGDFSNGTTDWIANDVTMSVSNNILAYTAKSQYATAHSSSMDSLKNISGHKVYARQRLKSDSTSVRLLGYNGTTYDFVLHSNGSSEWQTLSGIMTAGPSTNYVSSDDPRTSDWTPIYLTDVVWVDLTADFGAGNEPTKEHMDALLNANFPDSDGWFDGSAMVYDTESIGAAESVTTKDILIHKYPKATVTNIIKNATFAGNTNWDITGGSTLTVSNGVATMAYTAANNALYQFVSLKAGHTYYAAIQAKAVNGKPSLYLTNFATNTNLGIGIFYGLSYNFSIVSCIGTVGSSDITARLQLGTWLLDSTQYPGTAQFKNPILIDITELGLKGYDLTTLNNIFYGNSNLLNSIIAGNSTEIYNNSVANNICPNLAPIVLSPTASWQAIELAGSDKPTTFQLSGGDSANKIQYDSSHRYACITKYDPAYPFDYSKLGCNSYNFTTGKRNELTSQSSRYYDSNYTVCWVLSNSLTTLANNDLMSFSDSMGDAYVAGMTIRPMSRVIIDLTAAGITTTDAQEVYNLVMPSYDQLNTGNSVILSNNYSSRNSWISDYDIKGETIFDASRETRLGAKNLFVSDFSDYASYYNNGVEIFNHDSYRLDFRVTSSATGLYTRSPSIDLSLGHMYMFQCNVTSSVDTTNTRILLADSHGNGTSFWNGTLTAGTKTLIQGYTLSAEYLPTNIWFVFDESSAPAVGSTMTIEDPILIDLTALSNNTLTSDDTKIAFFNEHLSLFANYSVAWSPLLAGDTIYSGDPNIYESVLGRCDTKKRMTSMNIWPYYTSMTNDSGAVPHWFRKDHKYLFVSQFENAYAKSIMSTGGLTGFALTRVGTTGRSYGVGTFTQSLVTESGWVIDYNANMEQYCDWLVIMDLTRYGLDSLTALNAYDFFDRIGYERLAHGCVIGKPRQAVWRNILGTQNTKVTLSATGGGYYIVPTLDGTFINSGNLQETNKKIFYSISGHKYFVIFRTTADHASIRSISSRLSDGTGATSATVSYSDGSIYAELTSSSDGAKYIYMETDAAIDSFVVYGACVIDLSLIGYSSYTAEQMYNLLYPYLDDLFAGKTIRLTPDTRSLGDSYINRFNLAAYTVSNCSEYTDFSKIENNTGIKITLNKAKPNYNGAGVEIDLTEAQYAALGISDGDKIVVYSDVEQRGSTPVTLCDQQIIFQSSTSDISSVVTNTKAFGPNYCTYTVPTGTKKITMYFYADNYSSAGVPGDTVTYHDIALFRIDPKQTGDFTQYIPWAPYESRSGIRVINRGRNRLNLANQVFTNSNLIKKEMIGPNTMKLTALSDLADISNLFGQVTIPIDELGISNGEELVIYFKSITTNIASGYGFLNMTFVNSYGTGLTSIANSNNPSGDSSTVTLKAIRAPQQTNMTGLRIDCGIYNPNKIKAGDYAIFDGFFIGPSSANNFVYEDPRSNDIYYINLPTPSARAYAFATAAMTDEAEISKADSLSYKWQKAYKQIDAKGFYGLSECYSPTDTGRANFWLNPIYHYDGSLLYQYVMSNTTLSDLTGMITTLTGCTTFSNNQIYSMGSTPDQLYPYGQYVAKMDDRYAFKESVYMPDIRLYDDTDNMITIEDASGIAPSTVSYRYWAGRE